MPYTIRSAAKALRVTPPTVCTWLQNKELYEVPVHGGVRLVSDESVERKAAELGVELPAATGVRHDR